MIIGVDATACSNRRGYGRHARALLFALTQLNNDSQYVFVLDDANDLSWIPSDVEVRIVETNRPTAASASSEGRRELGDMWKMAMALSSKEFDVLVFPTVYSFVPVWSRAKKIVFIHDVIPEYFPKLTVPKITARYFWRAKSKLARLQADAIVTVSEYSKDRLSEKFNIPGDRIHVVGEASDEIFQKYEEPNWSTRLDEAGINRDERYFVYVGGFGPHKNISTLISVISELVSKSQYTDVRLLLVGEYQNEVYYSESHALQSQIQEMGINGSVIFTGYIPDEDLVMILNRAQGLVLPSLMEGFGLPAVEAAACGCPVIATTASPLPSLLGKAGIYIDPLNQQELFNAIITLLDSKQVREQMGVLGLQAAAALTWEKAAYQLKSVIDHLTSL